MRQRLTHSIKVRLTSYDYQNLISVTDKPSEFVRAAIREAILVNRSVNHKANSVESQVSYHAEPSTP